MEYELNKITKMRDEVLAVWRKQEGVPFLFVHVYVDGQQGAAAIPIRDAIFRRELPLALEAIRYGDRELYEKHPHLDDAQIWIHFDSANPAYNKLENWGTPGDYR